MLCEWFYIVLEYARTTMFMWMFIEGLFLHNLITVMVFRPDTYHKLYLVLGWGTPIVLTAIWAAFTATSQPTSAYVFSYFIVLFFLFLAAISSHSDWLWSSILPRDVSFLSLKENMCIYNRCWWGYNLTPSYWFLEGPRLTIILASFILFFLNSQRDFCSSSIESVLYWLSILGLLTIDTATWLAFHVTTHRSICCICLTSYESWWRSYATANAVKPNS